MTLYGIPPAMMRRALAPDTGRAHARDIVSTAHAWWLENRSTGEVHIALGTMAALALAAPTDVDGPDHGPLLIPLDDEEFIDAIRAVWNSLWTYHPDLVAAARPLHEWLAAPSDNDRRGLADYARVLVREGLLEYSSDISRCEADDPLGLLLQRMSNYSERQKGGVFFTPASAADLNAELLLPWDLPPGARFLEPCAGTGTMVRAAAATLRYRRLAPSSYWWWMNDPDPVNAACCAVNALLWRLGPCVMVSSDDALGNVEELQERARHNAEKATREQRSRPLLYPTRTRSPYWPA
ncbi:hypothetical protein AB0P37_48255 [Streptomyces antimycoticus]|uniref:hypothetical protein n=1 Tax=Streptomyces antimycoticus TaxID=68175 RepID=UPI003417D6C9